MEGEKSGDGKQVAFEVGQAKVLTKPLPKREYNLSDAALKQRREAAKKSRGPTTAEGKAISSRNSWKHGVHATSYALGIVGRPCLTTCAKYPCSLVDDGICSPGSGCLDKEFFLESLLKIQDAHQFKELDGVHEIYGLQLAKALNILNDLQDRITAEGTVIQTAKLDKDGRVVGWENALNPAMLSLPKMLGQLGISFDGMLLSPASIAKAELGKKEGEEENAMTVMARTLEKFAGVNVK